MKKEAPIILYYNIYIIPLRLWLVRKWKSRITTPSAIKESDTTEVVITHNLFTVEDGGWYCKCVS